MNTELNQMLPITQKDDQMWVDARSLHQTLGAKRDFSTWINGRLEEVGAIENQDYAVLDGSPISGNGYNPKPRRDYLLSLDLGKHVAMLERTPDGKTIRQYFIDAEKELRNRPVFALPTTMAEALRLAANAVERNQALEAAHAETTRVLELAAPKAVSFDRYLSTEGVHAFKVAANMLGWGRNRMLEELRRKKILISEGKLKNLPYQRFIEEGYFEVKARKVMVLGFERITQQAYVTPKGIEYLGRKIGRASPAVVRQVLQRAELGQFPA